MNVFNWGIERKEVNDASVVWPKTKWFDRREKKKEKKSKIGKCRFRLHLPVKSKDSIGLQQPEVFVARHTGSRINEMDTKLQAALLRGKAQPVPRQTPTEGYDRVSVCPKERRLIAHAVSCRCLYILPAYQPS